MVLTITAPLWADIGDREARVLGKVYGVNWADNDTKPLPIAGNDGVCVSPKPWWSHDAYGELQGYDEFDGTLQWTQAAGTVTKDSTPPYVLQGTSAMKLVTGAVAGNAATATRYFSPLIRTWQYNAIEFWFCLSAALDTTPREFRMMWTIADALTAHAHFFGIEYVHYNAAAPVKQWKYFDSTSTWVPFDPPALRTPLVTQCQFNYVLFEVNSQLTGNYLYHFLQTMDQGNIFFDAPPPLVAYTDALESVQFTVTTDAAAPTTAYIGAFILHNGIYSPWG